MDAADLKRFYNRCQPSEALEPDDDRNVDFDADPNLPRGVVWVDQLYRPIALSDTPVMLLFSGLPGTGKSTELRRLARRLADPAATNLLPVVVDAESVLDLTSPIDVPDIIATTVAATERAVLDAEGRNQPPGYLERLWLWMTTTDVELSKLSLGVGEVASLEMEMKARPTLREQIRKTVARNFTEFVKQARAELTALQERARALGRTGVVVIYDSIEKLRGLSTNFAEVLASAEAVFGGGAPYLKLPVHVVYTVPPALAARAIAGLIFMPMVKLHGRDDARTPYHPGMQMLRELVRRRIPDAALAKVLGPEVEARASELIRSSGGYPREIVRLLRNLLLSGTFPVERHAFDRVLNDVRTEIRQIVPSNAFAWLARVARDKFLTIENEEHRIAADLMLSNNVIMRYRNDDEWFDLHPAALEIPGVQAALARLGADG
jgi:hypothetical protein